MIKREGLPHDAKTNLEHKLQALEHRLRLKTKHEISKEIAEKLRKIFFIERTKVKRRLSKMRKKLTQLQAEGPDARDEAAVAKLEAELEEQQRVMDYVVNFPIKTEPYIPYLEESKMVPDWRKQRDAMMQRILREKKRRERVDETVDGFVAKEEDNDEESESTVDKSHNKNTKKRKHSAKGTGDAGAVADAADSKKVRGSNENNDQDQGSDAADGIAGDDFFA